MTSGLGRPVSPRRDQPLLTLERVAVALLTGLYAIVALATLTRRSLWVDESFTKAVALAPADHFLGDLSVNGGNMSLYLVFMRAWLTVAESDWWLRVPSVAFGAACVPALHRLAKQLLSARAAVLGAAVVAVSTPLVRHGQDARSYTLTTLLVILSWHAALRLAREDSTRARAWFVGLAAAVVYSHLIGVLFVAAQLGWLLVGSRRVAITASLWISLLVLPQVTMALGPEAQEPTWIVDTGAWALRETLRYLTGTEGYLAAGAVGSAWLLALVIARRRGGHESLVPLLWVVGPTAALLAITVVTPLLVPRYLVMVIPGVALAIAFVADAVPRLGALLAAGILVLVAPALYSSSTQERADWRAATDLVIQRSRADEAILFVNSRQLVAGYWRQAGRPPGVAVPATGPRSWGALRRTYDVDVDRAVRSLEDASGVWVVIRSTTLSSSDETLLSEVEARWRLTDSWVLSEGYDTWTLSDETIVIRHYATARPGLRDGRAPASEVRCPARCTG